MQAPSATETWSGLAELRPIVRRFLGRRCRDDSEAEDISQETLLRASRYRGSLADESRLRPWLLRIALNVLRDHVRRERRLPRVEVDPTLFDLVEGREGIPGEAREDSNVDVGGAIVEKPRALIELCDAKQGLHTRDRAVLDSHYEAGRSCRETAFVCEIPAYLVKVRLFRARKRLRRVLRTRLRAEARGGGRRFDPGLDFGARCSEECSTTVSGA